MDEPEFRRKAYQRVIDTLDGSVQAQGIKIKFPAWMVMGSPEWNKTPDNIKAHAFQAALVTGWSRISLTTAVCVVYEHIDIHMANFTVDVLEDLVMQYPLTVTERKKSPPKVTIVDGYGSRDL